MALKPDVTLSIVKNVRDCEQELRKLYRSNNHFVLNFEDTYRLPDKRHREQLIVNFEMKHINKYGDNDIKPYR